MYTYIYNSLQALACDKFKLLVKDPKSRNVYVLSLSLSLSLSRARARALPLFLSLSFSLSPSPSPSRFVCVCIWVCVYRGENDKFSFNASFKDQRIKFKVKQMHSLI